MYIYKLTHFAIHLKLTQHCKSTILQFFFFKDTVLESLPCAELGLDTVK